MRTELQNVQLPPPRFFQYSLDWRFLLPMADAQKTYVVFEEDDEFSQALEKAGIPLSHQHSFSSIKQKDNVGSLVFPFGLPVPWVSTRQEDQIEFYRTYRRLIEPGGHFLIGFNNALYTPSGKSSKYHASTPSRAIARLHQAGFKFIKVFGAMPDLSIPEYIFELRAQPMQFALSHRFRRKPALRQTLHVLAKIMGPSRFANLLPCYLVVAVA